MQLLLKRKYFNEHSTIGELFIDNKFFCHILEDQDRGLDSKMSLEELKNLKVKSQTAIPTGIYEIQITYSPRFKSLMPLLLNVPGFDGIRIHVGNSDEDTDGCLLPGVKDWDVPDKVWSSKTTYTRLFGILEKALDNDKVFISIVRDALEQDLGEVN